MATKVYVYGLTGERIPVQSDKPTHPGYRCAPAIPSNLPLIVEQMMLANRYRNSLAELDREKRAKIKAINERYEWEEITDLKAKRAEINNQVKELRQTIKDRNKGARKVVGSKEEQAVIKSLQAETKALTERIKELAASMPKVNWEQVKTLKAKIKKEKSKKKDKDKGLIEGWRDQIHELRSVDPSYLEKYEVEKWEREQHNARREPARLGTWKPLPWEREAPKGKVFWGTYQAVDEAYGLMIQSQDEPQFRRWDGDGKVAFHFQNDEVKPWKELKEGTNNKLTLKDTGTTAQGRKIWQASLWFASEKPGVPIYTEFRFLLHRNKVAKPVQGLECLQHREPEEDALVKWAFLVRKGGKWTLQLVVSEPDRKQRGGGAVALNVGWRDRNSSIRCLYAVKEDGTPLTLAPFFDQGEALIPADRVAQSKHYRDLREIRDKKFNPLIAALADELKTLEAKGELTDDHLLLILNRSVTEKDGSKKEIVASVAKWKSKDRLLYLIDRLLPKDQPANLPLSPELREALLAYRKWGGEPHLKAYEDGDRGNFQRWRLDFFRNLAAVLRKRFGKVLIDGTDYRDIARIKNPEEKKEYGVKDNKDVVSPSILRNIIAQALPTTKLDPDNITQRCHLCGNVNKEVGKEVLHTCENCGETADIDYRACMNLLSLSERLSE